MNAPVTTIWTGRRATRRRKRRRNKIKENKKSKQEKGRSKTKRGNENRNIPSEQLRWWPTRPFSWAWSLTGIPGRCTAARWHSDRRNEPAGLQNNQWRSGYHYNDPVEMKQRNYYYYNDPVKMKQRNYYYTKDPVEMKERKYRTEGVLHSRQDPSASTRIWRKSAANLTWLRTTTQPLKSFFLKKNIRRLVA